MISLSLSLSEDQSKMGFLYVAIKIPKFIDFTFLLNLLGNLKVMVMVALTHLGLLKPPQQNNSSEENTTANYVLVEWPTPPSLVPVPVHILMAAIKKMVPVVQYGEFLKNKFGMHHDDEEQEEEDEINAAACSVCLSCIERNHEIRELTNCSHVFHRECLDHWVDAFQVTCPLCRSMLFPTKVNNTITCGKGRYPWMMESCA